jgi:acylphosphatase
MSDQLEPADRQVGFMIHGRVQGVGFRWWTRRTAQSLGIAGSVRNRPDGSVEVRARGPHDALSEFETRLRRGPPSASVRRIESYPLNDVERAGFVIEP